MDANTAWLKGMQALSNKSISQLKRDIKLINGDMDIVEDARRNAVEVLESVIRFKKGKLLRSGGNVPRLTDSKGSL